MMNTSGNEMGHLILRGGRNGPNYDAESLSVANKMLEEADLPHRLVVDCSHANSNKDYKKQSVAWNDVIAQRAAGNDSIVGLMLESNLFPGNQKLTDDLSALKYGVSITDGCISIDETVELLKSAYSTLEATTAAVG